MIFGSDSEESFFPDFSPLSGQGLPARWAAAADFLQHNGFPFDYEQLDEKERVVFESLRAGPTPGTDDLQGQDLLAFVASVTAFLDHSGYRVDRDKWPEELEDMFLFSPRPHTFGRIWPGLGLVLSF